MIKLGLLVKLEAKPGKEEVVAKFLESGLALVMEEQDTMTWYGIKLGPSTFGIFDTFPHEEGRQTHLAGKVAEALMANAPDLLATDPEIIPIEVLAYK